MHYRHLGNTGIKVSRLCFGALTIGPLQKNLSLFKGASVIRRALELGVNFIDTAELYDTYDYIREALNSFKGRVVIASKSYDYTYDGMRKHVHKALQKLERGWIDIFLLHEQESELTIKGHWEAFRFLLDAKKAGLIKAVGISTHAVSAVRAAARIQEIDIIHPLVNIEGTGIRDGSVAEMLEAIKTAAAAGKGLYGMKALGGGGLISRVEESFSFVLNIQGFSSVAVGMSTVDEVDFNVRLFSGEKVPDDLRERLSRQDRSLNIANWCRGCGNCVERCKAGALKLIRGRAVVDKTKCRLCGYCGTVCPELCIKIF